MITERFMREADEPLIEESLAEDNFHKTTTVDFFKEKGTITKAYEDERGTILFARISLALRIDIQFLNNEDHERNRIAMLEGFPKLLESAKASGYKEIIFQSDNPMLRRFCVRRLGFYESGGEMRRII